MDGYSKNAFQQGAKATPNPAALLRTPIDANAWLARLGVDCQTYVRNYEADRRQTEFAVDLALNEAERLTGRRLDRTRLRFSGGHVVSTGRNEPIPGRPDEFVEFVAAGEDVEAARQAIALELYNHCMLAMGRTPGDTAVSKAALAYAAPTKSSSIPQVGLNLKSAGALSPMSSNLLWALGGAAVGYGAAVMMMKKR